MNALVGLGRLSAPQRRLVVEAAALMILLRLALTRPRVRPLQRLVARLGRAAPRRPGALEEVPWAIAAAGQRLPGTTCLVQALAAEVMLRRRGGAAVVRVGVAREPGGSLESHAWVECEGRVVVGDVGLDRYVPIATWGAVSP